MKPLYDLLKKEDLGKDGKPSVKLKSAKAKSKKGQQYNAKGPVTWDGSLQKALDDMINYLKSPEVIAYPDFNLPFFVTCDACKEGLGAVLYQKQNGINRVISYTSRTPT